MPLQKKKYEQVILYLCDKLGGEIQGKKKLAKLLYFADFDFFEKNQKPITGDVYKALPMGPVPVSFEEIVSEMSKNNMLNIRTIDSGGGYNPTEVYKSLVNLDDSVLDLNEKKMLDRIATKYGQLNGKQLGDLSHAEAPYVGTEPGKEIPYELSFYRGTDFSDL